MPGFFAACQIAGLGGTPGGQYGNYTHISYQASLPRSEEACSPLKSWEIIKQAAPQGMWYRSGL